MVIRGRAPLRVSFGGGGTDVAPFCVEQGGAIIGSTINKYAYCSIVPREDDQIIVHSLDFDMTVKYNTRENFVYDGKLDLVKAALKAMETVSYTHLDVYKRQRLYHGCREDRRTDYRENLRHCAGSCIWKYL